MDNKAKLKQISSIIKSFELQQDQIKQNIYKVNQLMTKKNASIHTLQQYYASYLEQWNDFSSNTIQLIRNNRLFYKKIYDAIATETKELDRLDTIKYDLIDKFKVLDKKISGLTGLYDALCLERHQRINNAEMNANLELCLIQRNKKHG